MKRYLKKDRYEMTLSEKETLWRKIHAQTHGDADQDTEETRGAGRRFGSMGRKRLLPAFSLTSVAALIALTILWHTGGVDKGFEGPVTELDMPSLEQPMPELRSLRKPAGTLGTDEIVLEQVPESRGALQGAPTEPKSTDNRQANKHDLFSGQYGLNEKQRDRDADVAAKSASRGNNLDAVDMDDSDPALVEEGQSRAAGAGKREGEQPVRSELPADVIYQVDGVAAVPEPEAAQTPGSVTGGTTPPNGEAFELMYFQHAGVNPFVATEDDALSTFAIDVDGASYALARSYLERGVLPPQDAIRVEEFVNYFAAGYPEQTSADFVIQADGAPSRFGEGYHLLRIGLQGRTIEASERKPANLIFVVDISGSMRQENRLGLVRRSLHVLLNELHEGDRVGIVVYGSEGEVRLQPTDVSRREVIERAIDGLLPGGSTNAYEGLDLAYGMARNSFEPGKIHRLILCSDGVANMGPATEAEAILKRVRDEKDEGINLSTVGFGMGNYNDILMETLADTGDGRYDYVDDIDEANRVFRENLTGTLQTVAREVKVQVAFDPERVRRWRLLGYENRDVADEDFRNDKVDAGEVGSGHQVTALYELKLIGREDWSWSGEDDTDDDPLAVAYLRWEAPRHDLERTGQVTEIMREITTADLTDDFADARARMRLAATVAEFAEILRDSYWAKESTLSDLVPVVDGLAVELNDPDVDELAKLVRKAAELQARATDE